MDELGRPERAGHDEQHDVQHDVQHDEQRLASGIYGLVVCSAALVASSTSERLSFVVVTVVVTLVVYWVAEGYAHVLARHAVEHKPVGWSEIRATMGHGWPMVSASFVPLLALLVAGALGASVRTADNISLLVATGLLLVTGWSASRDSGFRGWRLLVATSVSGLFGVTMVALKNLLH